MRLIACAIVSSSWLIASAAEPLIEDLQTQRSLLRTYRTAQAWCQEHPEATEYRIASRKVEIVVQCEMVPDAIALIRANITALEQR